MTLVKESALCFLVFSIMIFWSNLPRLFTKSEAGFWQSNTGFFESETVELEFKNYFTA